MAETAVERVPSPYQRRVVPQGLMPWDVPYIYNICRVWNFIHNFLRKIFKKVFANGKFYAIMGKFLKWAARWRLASQGAESPFGAAKRAFAKRPLGAGCPPLGEIYAKRKDKKYCNYRPC